MTDIVKSETNYPRLKQILDEFEKTFDYAKRIEWDPVQFPRMFSTGDDIETAGLIASSLAYGSVKIIISVLKKIFTATGTSPSEFVKSENPEDYKVLNGLYHRFNNSDDIKTLLWSAGRIRKEYGSLEQLFLEGYTEKGISEDEKFRNGLERFSTVFIDKAKNSPFGDRRAFDYFFPRPSGGSPCKRLCLYTRWMVRNEPVDMGIWKSVSPSHLVIPVDVHIARIGRYLGFTETKNANWKMAQEISRSLRKMDNEDPLRYDFVLCHLGISGECPGKFDSEKCMECFLKNSCIRV
ncbi:MAG: TIGR02757 family protein [Firmicutes bacterium]|nr:TIGR02757 family protein [Bacillota bacterium]